MPQHWNKWKSDGPLEINNKKFNTVHIFSGGIFKYNCWMTHNPNCLGHSKLILDSTPFFPYPRQLTTYIYNELPVLKTDKSIHYMDNFINFIWNYNNFDYNKHMGEYKDNINCERPKLLIKGDNDSLLKHNTIEEEIKRWEKKSSVYRPELFMNNGHLDHYKNNPEEYKESIYKFINL